MKSIAALIFIFGLISIFLVLFSGRIIGRKTKAILFTIVLLLLATSIIMNYV